jgi:biopolymer transport protein ExbD
LFDNENPLFQKPDLNITPLVDVMLVLLAILMVTAPVLEYEEPINLPKGSSSQKVSDVKNINIVITKDGNIKVNKKEFTLKTFADDFGLFSNNMSRDIPIHIRGDKNLIYNDVIFILKTVKETGFLKVSLITDG